MWLEALLVFTFLLLILKLNYGRKSKNFWKEHGIDFIDTSKFVSTVELVLGTKNMADVDQVVYEKMRDKPFVGIMDSGTPILIVKDLDLARDVFIKDFEYFTDRRVEFRSSQTKSLLYMLPSLTGSEWRSVRVAMSPTFTTGKMRRLMDRFNESGTEWTAYIKDRAEAGHAIDIKSASSQYSLDVIASGLFGLSAGALKDPHSPFIVEAEKFAKMSPLIVMKKSIALRFPNLFKFFGLNSLDKGMTDFFDGVFTEALKARESGRNPPRIDFLQLIVEARKGALKTEGNDELNQFEKEAILEDESFDKNHQGSNILLNDDVARAQALIFFIAGYHGVSLTVSYITHALAFHQDMQERMREELDEVFKDDGTISYDDLNNLEFMDMFVSETLRYYPITPRLPRMTVKDYYNKEFNLKIPKGTAVEIPVPMIHKDPKHYENPDVFDPEHFNSENKRRRHNYGFLAFGHGPRNCIGMRFALIEVKVMVAHIVRNFMIERDSSTPAFPLKTKLVGQGYFIVGDVPLKFIPRKTC